MESILILRVLDLEGEDLVMELADGIRRGVAKFLEIFLHCVDHGRRTTEKELAVGGIRIGYVLFNVLFGDETNATVPSWRWNVENVADLESIESVCFLELVEIFPEKDIFDGNVGVNEGDF